MKKDIVKLINNNPWFARYYDFNELNITGLRDNIQRQKIYDKFEFKNKNILDVGCNLGKNFMHLHKKSPKKMVGLDLQYTINTAIRVNNFYDIDNINFIDTDLNDKNWYKEMSKKTGIKKFDYSLFVSVYGTKELHNRDGILKELLKNTKKCIFFEGHHLNNHKDYSKVLLKHNVNNFFFEGYLRDKESDFTSEVRPFFTIFQEEKNYKDVNKIINKILQNKGRVVIGIEGLAGSGKTTLVKQLKKDFGYLENGTFIDDLKDSKGNYYKSSNSKLKHIKNTLYNKIKKYLNIKKQTINLDSIIYNKTSDIVVISDHKVRQYVDHVNILVRLDVDKSIRTNRLEKRNGGTLTYKETEIFSKNFSSDNLITIKST